MSYNNYRKCLGSILVQSPKSFEAGPTDPHMPHSTSNLSSHPPPQHQLTNPNLSSPSSKNGRSHDQDQPRHHRPPRHPLPNLPQGTHLARPRPRKHHRAHLRLPLHMPSHPRSSHAIMRRRVALRINPATIPRLFRSTRPIIMDAQVSTTKRTPQMTCDVITYLILGSVAHLNLAARSTKDAVVALSIDKPNGASFDLNVLKTPNFPGTAGDGLLDLIGFTGIDHPDTGLVELLLINNGPSVDPVTGRYADQYVAGANSTIELFETGGNATELKHVHTYAHKHIATPNRIAALSRDAFYVTNDHGPHKMGLVRRLPFPKKPPH